MLNSGLSVRVFQRDRDFPRIVTVYDNVRGSHAADYLVDRQVSLGYLDYYSGKIGSMDKLKTEDSNAFASINGTQGKADKIIKYYDNNTSVSNTTICKGFVPLEKNSFETVKGIPKANYAFLERTLQDGDVVQLTMKQGGNGKYEAIAMASKKGKTLKDLPQVKEMLLKLDPLVKRFIKVAR